MKTRQAPYTINILRDGYKMQRENYYVTCDSRSEITVDGYTCKHGVEIYIIANIFHLSIENLYRSVKVQRTAK